MKKKITMLLAALLVCVGAAVAQVQEGKAYYLKVANLEGYIDTKNAHSDNFSSTIKVTSEPVKTYFKKGAAEDSWLISVDPECNSGFLTVERWCANPNQQAGDEWKIVASGEADIYHLTQSEYQGGNNPERIYLGRDGGAALNEKLYADQAVANAVKVQFVEATQPTTTVTYTFKYGDKTIATQETKDCDIDAEFPEITVALPMGVVATKPAGTVSEENANQTIEVSIDNSMLPFVAAESYESIEHWYYMNIRDDGPTYAYYDSSISYIKADKSAVDKKNKDVYSWAFIGNPIDGFSIVNKAAGETMVLSSPVAPSKNGDKDQVVRMVTKNDAKGNLVWTIMSPTHNNAAAGAFYVQHPTEKNWALNRQGFNGGNALCYWNNRDTGSALQVVERIMGAVADLEDLITDANNLKTDVEANIGTKIGEYTQATAEALGAAIEKANDLVEAENATTDDVNALQAAMDAVKTILPTVGQYYQIHSSLDKFATEQGAEIVKAVYSNGTEPRWKTLNADDKSFYWLAVAAENGNVVFKNAADDKYMVANAARSGAWSMADAPTAASNISVKIFNKENEKGYEYGVIMNNWQMHCNGHTEGKGVENNIVSWNTDNANSASSWFLVPVELEKFYDITYNFVYNNIVKYSTTVSVAEGAAYPAVVEPVLPYGVTAAAATPEGTVTEDKTFEFTLSVNEKEQLPFETATDVNSITTWYYAQMHANGNVTAYVEDNRNNTNNVEWADKSVAADEIDSHLWGFVGDIWGLKMINKGTGRAIVSKSGAAVMGDAANATELIPTKSKAGGDWFCLNYPGTTSYLNAQGDKIASWSDNDNGSSFKLTLFQEKEVSISNLDYSTLYLDYAAYIPEGVEVYAVSSIENGYVTLAQVEGGVLPANTGVILKNAGEYTFKAAGATASVTSELKGTATDVATSTVNGVVYTLQSHEGGVAFKKFTGETILANKAYLVLPAETKALRIRFAGEETGIDQFFGDEELVIYDLAGRRVEKMEKGIYIVNGKKVVIK